MAWLQALLEIIPLIRQLLDLFIKTPQEKRQELISRLSAAFQKLQVSHDTSDLEDIIRGGHP